MIEGFLCCPEVADLRILFTINWPVKAITRGRHGFSLEINWIKFIEIYPFLNHANFCKPSVSVNQKKKLSPAEQANLYRKLLESGKVKNKAAIAKKFGVSRAWVSKILGSNT